MMEENDKLPLTEGEKEEMPEIVCTGCSIHHLFVYHGFVGSTHRGEGGTIRGLLTCTVGRVGEKCGGETLFELSDNGISWAPGNIFHEDLSPRTSPTVRELFREAVRAFYGGACKGVVALCRSAVERSLDEKNVTCRDLFAKTTNAPRSILGTREKTWADASRLDGRDALHRLMAVTPTQALSSLNTTIQLINHIVSTDALPATQSETASNES